MDLQRLSRPRTDVSVPDGAEIWDLTSEEAGAAIETLAADTARAILATLYEEPRTASEIAEATEHSLQNVNYHLGNLREANLIEVADTRYSQKGTEMKIYSPTTNAVLLLSQETTAERIRNLLSRLVGGIGLLAIAALAFRSVIVGGVIDVPGIEVETVPAGGDEGDDAATGDTDDAGDGEDGLDEGGGTDDATEGSTDAEQGGEQEDVPEFDGLADTDLIVETINPLEHLPLLLDPGVVFFLGGLVMLLVFLGVQLYRGRL